MMAVMNSNLTNMEGMKLEIYTLTLLAHSALIINKVCWLGRTDTTIDLGPIS